MPWLNWETSVPDCRKDRTFLPSKALSACLSLALAGGTVPTALTCVAAMSDGPHVRTLAPRRSASSEHPHAVTHEVVNCDDSGLGSLRDVVAGAASGDTVDMGQLTCSTITLTSGAIVVSQDDLTIGGSFQHQQTITANDASQIFVHTGTGTLAVGYVTLEHGYAYARNGGCIASSGSLFLTRAYIDACSAYNFYEPIVVRGGGIYAAGSVQLHAGSVTGCSAQSIHEGAAVGGGIYAGGLLYVSGVVAGNHAAVYASFPSYSVGGGASSKGLVLQFATVSGNSATAPADTSGLAGGVVNYGYANVLDSTIDNNIASSGVGGLWLKGVGHPATFRNSTISDNSGGNIGGMIVAGQLTLESSTVAFNHGAGVLGGGIYINYGQLFPPTLQSSIIADNTIAGDGFADLYLAESGATLYGANNLVMSANLQLSGTITADPMLGPLADNGGPTRTRALRPGSPAIDAGNNVENQSYDQRDSPHPRVIGSSTDIGAFELDTTDVIFADGFD